LINVYSTAITGSARSAHPTVPPTKLSAPCTLLVAAFFGLTRGSARWSRVVVRAARKRCVTPSTIRVAQLPATVALLQPEAAIITPHSPRCCVVAAAAPPDIVSYSSRDEAKAELQS